MTPEAEQLHQQRVAELAQRLSPEAVDKLLHLLDGVRETPAEELLGPGEFLIRERGFEFFRELHQSALTGRKKGATSGRAPSAPAATPTPSTRALDAVAPSKLSSEK